MSEAALSLLGLGLPVDQPSLGALISIGFNYIFSGAWWITVFPGLVLVTLVLVINLLGEWGMSPAERLDFVKQHVELGITTVDHAAIYGSDVPCETLFGEALALEHSLREQLHIITKLGIIAPQSEGGNRLLRQWTRGNHFLSGAFAKAARR
jgi:hypothetical protein